MINAALAAENLNRFDEALITINVRIIITVKGNVSIYDKSLNSKNENKDDQKILSVIEEGKNKFPNDFVLNVKNSTL